MSEHAPLSWKQKNPLCFPAKKKKKKISIGLLVEESSRKMSMESVSQYGIFSENMQNFNRR
jgi:hypothetical protein